MADIANGGNAAGQGDPGLNGDDGGFWKDTTAVLGVFLVIPLVVLIAGLIYVILRISRNRQKYVHCSFRYDRTCGSICRRRLPFILVENAANASKSLHTDKKKTLFTYPSSSFLPTFLPLLSSYFVLAAVRLKPKFTV